LLKIVGKRAQVQSRLPLRDVHAAIAIAEGDVQAWNPKIKANQNIERSKREPGALAFWGRFMFLTANCREENK